MFNLAKEEPDGKQLNLQNIYRRWRLRACKSDRTEGETWKRGDFHY